MRYYTITMADGRHLQATRRFWDFLLFDTFGFTSYRLLDGKRIRINRHFTMDVTTENTGVHGDSK